jgi:hypothetical protein
MNDFTNGTLAGFGSDVGTKYIDTQYDNATAYYAGRIFGDTLALTGAFGGAGVSLTEEVVGTALDATGFGALIGVAVNVVGAIQLTASVKVGFSASVNLGGDTAGLVSHMWSDGGGGSSSEGTGGKGTPGNNQAQNKQVNDIVNKLGLTKAQRRQLHDEITGQNYGYQEILKIAEYIKNGQ